MKKLGLLVWRRKSLMGGDPIKISSASLGILPLTVGAFMQDTESLQRLGCLLLFCMQDLSTFVSQQGVWLSEELTCE